MDTCSLLPVAIWLGTLIELNLAQLYSSIPLHVFTVPSQYPWSAPIRAPETPISRKLISSYPSDILVQSNSIYYPPNSNSLPRNYFLPNPIPGKSPIIFRPTSLHRHPIPIRYEFSRVGNSLKTKGEPISKDSRRTGFVLDNSLGLKLDAQSSEPVRFWESKTVPVKPFSFSVYDGSRPEQQDSGKLSEKVESPTTSKPEMAKLEPEATPTGTPAEVTTLPESSGFVKRDPDQFYKKEKNGRVIFGFSTDDQTRMESRDADAKVYGAYTYFDPSGNPVRMQYWDEGKGFHTAGNRLPQNVVSLPQVVTDTPEVQAARELHLKLYEQTLAHLTELQNLRPPADNNIYGEYPSGPSNRPTAAPPIAEEDDDPVIIDSQKLPDNDFAPALGKDIDYDLPTPTERSVPDPTPNSESQNDPESVVIENPHIRRSITKRSIGEKKNTRGGKKMSRQNAIFFEHSFTGNSPTFTTAQFPLFPTYSVLPATRVFTTTPTQFRPSPPEEAHPIPGKFAPSVKDTPPSKLNTPKLADSPFSDVAHKFEDLLYSRPPVSGPSAVASEPFTYDEFRQIFLEHPDEAPSPVGYPDEPQPWLTAPSAPEVYKEEIPSASHKTHTKLDFSAPSNSFSSFPPSKFNPPEILASDFHVKDGHKKGPHFYGSNPLFSGFSLPQFVYPQSSQTIIRTDRPYDFKYHGSGPFHFLHKAPVPSVNYHVSHFDDDSHHFNFPTSFSRPFIGHDYTLVDKNFPSSNSPIFFSSSFIPTAEFPGTHLSGETLDNNKGLPNIGKDPVSGSKGDDLEKDKKPEVSTDKPVEQTTTDSLKIVVPNAPAIDIRNELPGATSVDIVKSTDKPDASTAYESTETNMSAESTEPNSVLSNEGDKSDSSLVSDGRLSAEESTSVVESITEMSTEAATEKTGSETEKPGNEYETYNNNAGSGSEKTGSEYETSSNSAGSETEKTGSEPEIKYGKSRNDYAYNPERTGNEAAETETKSPEEPRESNLVRRNANGGSVPMADHLRRAAAVAAVHDIQVSPKQRKRLANYH